jgi:NAD-dependent deacetylase
MEKSRKRIVMLTGAGVSADSGIETFRAEDGLWAKHRVEDVCTPEALKSNLSLVLEFYNERRRQLREVKPNAGHYAVAELESFFEVDVVTQNIDDLHERAGSSRVLHLHGELLKCSSMSNPDYLADVEGDILEGDLCPGGGQLRPFVVFFGEPVPMIPAAAKLVSKADIIVVAGTSLAVYPAAGLVSYANHDAKMYVLDPSAVQIGGRRVKYIRERFASGMPGLKDVLVKEFFGV